MKKREIRELCSSLGIHPNKKLGQNFLYDAGVIGRIIDTCEIDRTDRVLEIGPGLGALTNWLVERASAVTAVEIDSGMVRYLREAFRDVQNLEIVHADFLKHTGTADFTRCISNLPYYCSSEILFRLATAYAVPRVFVMLQKEMAERIVARPGSRSYGALSLNLSLYFDTSILFHIDRNSFYPAPDVVSAFIGMKRKELPLGDREVELFHQVVRSAFWGRRKKIINALSESPHLAVSRGIVETALRELGIDARLRGEHLDFDQYIRLTEILFRLVK